MVKARLKRFDHHLPHSAVPTCSAAALAVSSSTCWYREVTGGMTATAMRVVNAIPYVVDADPGLTTSLDIPLTLPQGLFGREDGALTHRKPPT
jgi:hypothetical protein